MSSDDEFMACAPKGPHPSGARTRAARSWGLRAKGREGEGGGERRGEEGRGGRDGTSKPEPKQDAQHPTAYSPAAGPQAPHLISNL